MKSDIDQLKARIVRLLKYVLSHCRVCIEPLECVHRAAVTTGVVTEMVITTTSFGLLGVI